jgi:hypothetical protein
MNTLSILNKYFIKTKINLAILTTLFLTSSNCLIDYKEFPKVDTLNSQMKIYDKKLVYNLPYFPQFNLGGKEALETYFQVKTPFKNTEAGTKIPLDGFLVDVKVDYRSPSTPALVFLTASTLTATILPAWSMHDGYDIRYILYKDGKKVETFSYQVERKYAQWFLILPIIWMNNDTASEKSVFERLTETFFKDAKKHF